MVVKKEILKASKIITFVDKITFLKIKKENFTVFLAYCHSFDL